MFTLLTSLVLEALPPSPKQRTVISLNGYKQAFRHNHYFWFAFISRISTKDHIQGWYTVSIRHLRQATACRGLLAATVVTMSNAIDA